MQEASAAGANEGGANEDEAYEAEVGTSEAEASETEASQAARTLHDGIESALSLERFGRYMAWAENERLRALELYLLNMRLSEVMYSPLQMLEVALRNRIHAVMTEDYYEKWFEDDGLLIGDKQKESIADAIAYIKGEGKEPTTGRIVAAQSLGFWISMFDKKHDEIWKKGLYRIAKTPDGKHLLRKKFYKPLKIIRILRNRIAHHEPIIHWNLPKYHDSIIKNTEYLSISASNWSKTHSRFYEFYPDDGIFLSDK